MRLFSRNAYDRTARLLAIASAAERIEAGSFTIDGGAVVLGSDSLQPLRRVAQPEVTDTAILSAFESRRA